VQSGSWSSWNAQKMSDRPVSLGVCGYLQILDTDGSSCTIKLLIYHPLERGEVELVLRECTVSPALRLEVLPKSSDAEGSPCG
jgi:hypothetical protein